MAVEETGVPYWGVGGRATLASFVRLCYTPSTGQKALRSTMVWYHDREPVPAERDG